MSIGFVIPLKSKRISEDWQLTCALLKRTIDSLINQTCSNFKIAVVGHEKPDFLEQLTQNVDFLPSPFELPPLASGGSYRYHKDFDRILDKYRKIGLGLKHFKSKNLTYIMVLDADDFVHQNLVEYVLKTNDPNGYIIRYGYEYYSQAKKIVAKDNLDAICGSTTIIHTNHLNFSDSADNKSTKSIPWCHLSHSEMESYFIQQNKPLKIVPFASLMYVLQHGQNASNEFRESFKAQLSCFIKLSLLAKKVSPTLLADYGITE